MSRLNEKKQLISYENSIQKSNEFSMAKLNQGLTLHQTQLFAYAIYCTQQNGETHFNKADFEKKFSLEKYHTVHAKKDSDKIMGLRLSFEDLENDTFRFTNVFSDMEYNKGRFVFAWNPKILPHIIDLQEKYITTDLTITSKFKSSFSWTLYEYLKAHHGYWHKSLSKDATLRLFGVEKVASYKRNTSSLKKKVLDVAIAEINELTEFKVWYQDQKKGRAIVGFKIEWSTGKKEATATKAQIELLDSIIHAAIDDLFAYMTISNDDDRILAVTLANKLRDMLPHTAIPIEITSSYASTLIDTAKIYFDQIQSILERNNLPQRPVPFYNWIDERE